MRKEGRDKDEKGTKEEKRNKDKRVKYKIIILDILQSTRNTLQ
jgi:hypothetical protein